jgi:hypothetical protein
MLNKLQIVEGIKAGAIFGDDLGKERAKCLHSQQLCPTGHKKNPANNICGINMERRYNLLFGYYFKLQFVGFAAAKVNRGFV